MSAWKNSYLIDSHGLLALETVERRNYDLENLLVLYKRGGRQDFISSKVIGARKNGAREGSIEYKIFQSALNCCTG